MTVIHGGNDLVRDPLYWPSALAADEAQDKILRTYRDQVADAVGLRLPGHDAYTFHITLAYTWRLPDEYQVDCAGTGTCRIICEPRIEAQQQ